MRIIPFLEIASFFLREVRSCFCCSLETFHNFINRRVVFSLLFLLCLFSSAFLEFLICCLIRGQISYPSHIIWVFTFLFEWDKPAKLQIWFFFVTFFFKTCKLNNWRLLYLIHSLTHSYIKQLCFITLQHDPNTSQFPFFDKRILWKLSSVW